MLVDSHCHLDRLDLTAFEGCFAKAMQHSFDEGIDSMLCVNVEMKSFASMLELIKPFENIVASFGIHPCHVEDDGVFDVETIIDHASHQQVVAIGESGLDYFHRPKEQVLNQLPSFHHHIEASIALDKPIIVHSRHAREDTMEILQAYRGRVRGVMHCFSEDWDMAKKALDLGMYISFSGNITYKNAHSLQEVVRQVPIEQLLVETDSPWLAPVPHRGKRNYPFWVKHVADQVATLKNLSFEEVAKQTSSNFYQLFGKAAKQRIN